MFALFTNIFPLKSEKSLGWALSLTRAGGIKIFNDLRPVVVGGRKVAVGVGILTHKLFVAGEEKARYVNRIDSIFNMHNIDFEY